MIRSLTLLFALALTGLVAPVAVQAAAAETRTVTLDVPGMTCNFCPVTIRKALQQVDGVIEAKASFDTKTATIIYDPSRTDTDQLLQATANAGYPATLRQ